MRILDDLIQNVSLEGKTVLLRADLNVPMLRGKVADNTRIVRVVPSINALLKAGAKVVVISHFGRPNGEFSADLSLAPIADALGTALDMNVMFGVDCVGTAAKNAVDRLESRGVLLLENLRFHTGEKKNDPEFVSQLAELGDYFINDAFSCSHRTHASIYGVAKKLPSYAGYLFQSEVENLQHALDNPERPVAAIVGGSKISTKITMLENLITKVDYLMIGGGMANTFLYAQGHNVGKSLCEKGLRDIALEIMKKSVNCEILLPSDAIISSAIDGNKCEVVSWGDIADDQMILDIGVETVLHWSNKLKECKTLIWNGPLGAFEHSPFDVGTISISRVVSGLTKSGQLQSIAGGGDVLSALLRSRLRDNFTYISTAGGAFLEWLEGNELPGVKVL